MKIYLKITMITSIVILFLSGCGQPVVPSEQLKYIEVIEHKENSSNAFELSKMWLAITFNDSKSVVEYTNPEKGIIIGKGVLKNVDYGTMVTMDTRFTLKIEVKDNKSRLTFQDMVQFPTSSTVPPFNMWNFDSLEKFKSRAKNLVYDYNRYINSNNKVNNW